MHYYVDGYNLLFRASSSKENLQTRRNKLIEEFALKAAYLKLPMTLVFDSGQQPREASKARRNFLDVVYTASNETADEYIVTEVRESTTPKKQTVVTSDRELAARIRRLGAATVTVESFRGWLEQRLRNKKAMEVIAEAPAKKVKKTLVAVDPVEAAPQKVEDFYLSTFTERLEELEKNEPVKPIKKKNLKRRKPSPKIPKQPYEYDEVRWLRAFQRKLEENE